VTEHLYWTLYTGVLGFWASNPPPDRDETLAVLDHSIRAFVGWLDAPGPARTQSSPESEGADAAHRRGTRRISRRRDQR
jgi:hypothetical protein